MDANIAIIIIAGCAFVVRALPRLLYPHAYNYDTYFHLHIAQKIRANLFRELEVIPVNRTYKAKYPQGYHFFLALFPRRMMPFMEHVSSPLFDTLVLLAMYAAMHGFWKLSGLEAPRFLPETACLLYAFSPAMLRVGSGPRAYSGTPRILGQLLYFVHICLAFWAVSTGSVVAGAAAAAVICLFPLVAKFTVQVLFFFAIPMCVLMGWGYTLIFLSGFAAILAVPVCRAYFLEHMRFIANYYKKTRHGFIGFAPRTWKEYSESFRVHGMQKLRDKTYVRFLFWCLDEQYFPHYLLLCQTPVLLLFLAPPASVIPAQLDHLLTGWVACGFFWGVVTKTRWLMPVGEGERYIEYCYPALLIAATARAWGNPALLFLLCLVTLPLGAVCIFRVIKRIQPLEKQYADYKEAYDFLNALPGHGEVLPVGYVAYPGLLFSNKNLHGFLSDPERCLLTDEEHHLLRKTYPLPDPDLKAVTDHFKTTYVVAQQWAWNDYTGLMPDKGAAISGTKPLFNNDGMVIFAVEHFKLDDADA